MLHLWYCRRQVFHLISHFCISIHECAHGSFLCLGTVNNTQTLSVCSLYVLYVGTAEPWVSSTVSSLTNRVVYPFLQTFQELTPTMLQNGLFLCSQHEPRRLRNEMGTRFARERGNNSNTKGLLQEPFLYAQVQGQLLPPGREQGRNRRVRGEAMCRVRTNTGRQSQRQVTYGSRARPY